MDDCFFFFLVCWLRRVFSVDMAVSSTPWFQDGWTELALVGKSFHVRFHMSRQISLQVPIGLLIANNTPPNAIYRHNQVICCTICVNRIFCQIVNFWNLIVFTFFCFYNFALLVLSRNVRIQWIFYCTAVWAMNAGMWFCNIIVWSSVLSRSEVLSDLLEYTKFWCSPCFLPICFSRDFRFS